MPFSIFQLAFAAAAIGLLAVLFLIVRRVRQTQSAQGSPPSDQPMQEGAGPRVFGKAKQATEPEPQPQPRRRQLRPISEVEQSETPPAEAPVLMAEQSEMPLAEAPIEMAEHAVAEPAIVEDNDLEPTPAEHPVDELDYGTVVLTRLEGCFERLQAGELTLDAYTAELVAERAIVDERIAMLRAGGESERLEQALAAGESVRWCLDWAAEQARAEG